jgi:hypothetical protein
MRIKRSFETTHEDRKDDSSSFDVQLAYWRSVHASMVGYWRNPDTSQCRRDARQKCNRIATRPEELACSICGRDRSTPGPDELHSETLLFAA